MNFTPLSDRVLVLPETQESVTASGLIIPDTAEKDKPQIGTVMAIGPGRTTERGELVPMHVRDKDVVLFGSWAGVDINLDGQHFLMLREVDILGYHRPEGAGHDEDG